MEWNNEIAYAIGLIVTDGNLSKDGRHIVFVSKDISLVELFKKCLNLKNHISTKTSGYSNKKGKYYYVQFGNINFYRNLISIGLCANKSKRIGQLRIPKNYLADFLRGHLDGDGTIRAYTDYVFPNSRRLYVNFMSASKKHITWLQKTINTTYKIKGRIRAEHRIWILIYAKEESKILLRKIYPKQDIPLLRRKWLIAKTYLN